MNTATLVAVTAAELALIILVLLFFIRLRRSEQMLSALQSNQDDLMERARELLKLETIPRELVVGLVEKIEVGEKHRSTGQQNVSITWKF